MGDCHTCGFHCGIHALRRFACADGRRLHHACERRICGSTRTLGWGAQLNRHRPTLDLCEGYICCIWTIHVGGACRFSYPPTLGAKRTSHHGCAGIVVSPDWDCNQYRCADALVSKKELMSMKKYFIRKNRLGNVPSLFVYNDIISHSERSEESLLPLRSRADFW